MTQLSGMLVINKPVGMITKDISRWLQKRLGAMKMGHVGTLDPIAEGIVPILFNKATKLQDILLEFYKTYEFVVEFGKETTTLDGDGAVIHLDQSRPLAREVVERGTERFVGEIEQTIPAYSAVKYCGKPLYYYARKGKIDEILSKKTFSKKVIIHDFKMLDFQYPMASFRVSCSKGTYVRSLAADLAGKCGTTGTIVKLKRLEAAGIEIGQAHSLDELESIDIGNLKDYLIPIEKINLKMPGWQSLSMGFTDRLRRGQRVLLDENYFMKSFVVDQNLDYTENRSKPILLYKERGQLLGLGECKKEQNGKVSVYLKRGLE